MSRLIDADDFGRVIKEYCKECIEHNKYKMDVVDINADIQGLLDNQPTAFDVDKVVEQLEEISHCDWIEVRKEEVFEIIKAGGRDE